jgi:hypothetical protein
MEPTALAGAIDELFEQGPEAFADGQSVLDLLTSKARLEAFLAEAVAGFEASGEWRLTEARSARAWLMAEARLSEKEAGSDGGHEKVPIGGQ